MASIHHYQTMKSWFTSYSQSFLTSDLGFNRNIQLKIDHTMRVIAAIEDIASHLKISPNDVELSRIIALFHDLGRFQQFFEYNTFADRKSVNHAHLAVNILQKKDILAILPPNEQILILSAINYHNVAHVPLELSDQEIFFTKLIRDADKIDIYKVVCDHYQNPDPIFANTIELGLPNSQIISDKVFTSIMNDQLVKHEDIVSVTDFKILQLAWVFDLNFPRSFEIIKERRYIEILNQTLPQTEKMAKIYEKVKNYLINRS
ncbi:hypothetical protein NEF87_002453 [Candidatus Lokiarchaeum ossiferum]|uniref:HD domain-containing protein n=1 Tax=Candidatus Lokiarchaeum ossiferum TaxID=2951803 RepID=A0ABY6HRN0_9ARCH|nr:hypothetical protein NEF87_002453 [Candidatus Lokiarchaeum sp. B-35]